MKKIILIILLISIFIFPRNAHAIPVEDVGNIAQSTISATANTTSASSNYMLQVKEYILDNVAWTLAKMTLREITTSTVKWINSGFEGNPGFISNPAEFFKNVGDELLGQMIFDQKSLAFLCSPFSLDLKLQLAFKYSPFQKRIACTLTDVIKNATGAVQNASINGFTAGDFSQGGWPAFVSMTTEPQNNLYGAYVQADFELSARIANMEKLKSDELNQGRGFLSWRKCTTDKDTIASNQESDAALAENPLYDGTDPYNQYAQDRSQNCDIYTPGSVIAGVLDANTTGPLQDLHIADEINEVVGALFSQLVTKTLTVGLKGLSGSGSGDPQSYVNRLENEQGANNQQLQTIKTNILRDIDKYINKELEFKAQKNTTLKTYLNVKTKLDIAKNCYINKQQTLPLTPDQLAYTNQQIGSIVAKTDYSITSTSTRIISDIALADENITALRSIKQRTTAAKTVNEVSDPSYEYGQIAGSIHNEKDLLDARTENTISIGSLDSLNRYSDLIISSCNVYPN
jgi:hypothetical protein